MKAIQRTMDRHFKLLVDTEIAEDMDQSKKRTLDKATRCLQYYLNMIGICTQKSLQRQTKNRSVIQQHMRMIYLWQMKKKMESENKSGTTTIKKLDKKLESDKQRVSKEGHNYIT